MTIKFLQLHLVFCPLGLFGGHPSVFFEASLLVFYSLYFQHSYFSSFVSPSYSSNVPKPFHLILPNFMEIGGWFLIKLYHLAPVMVFNILILINPAFSPHFKSPPALLTNRPRWHRLSDEYLYFLPLVSKSSYRLTKNFTASTSNDLSC